MKVPSTVAAVQAVLKNGHSNYAVISSPQVKHFSSLSPPL